MKTLIIFALITLISYITSQSISYTTTYECPDDKKIKIGEDVCAILSGVKGTNYNTYNYYIKKKSCGKKKGCKQYGSRIYNQGTGLYDQIYTCQKKVKLLKIKKKCNHNAECNTAYCNNGKCAASEKCYGSDSMCGPGKYCKGYDSSNYPNIVAGTCTDYVKEGVVVGTDEKCAPGYGKFTDPDTSEITCKKYFSLDKSKPTSGDEFCKSLYSVNDKCAELIKVETPDNYCSITYDNGEGQKTTTGSATVGENSLYETIDGVRNCLYSTGKKELVDELVKRYNKIKLDKLLEKEDCDYGSDDLCDKKYAELNAVYNDYDTLRYLKLIKDNGEKNKDKKCEYEFWRTMNVSSSYVNVCFGVVFALLSLLF